MNSLVVIDKYGGQLRADEFVSIVNSSEYQNKLIYSVSCLLYSVFPSALQGVFYLVMVGMIFVM